MKPQATNSWLIGFVLLGLVASHARAQTADPLSDAQKQVLKEAVEAANKEDWATCRIKMAGLWDRQRDFRIAGFLGLCEVELGMFKEGAEHLNYYTVHDDKSDAARTKKIESRFERAKREVASVAVSCNESDARVLVDKRVIGDVPTTMFLDARTYSVSAEKQGFHGEPVEITVKKGESLPVTITLAPIAAPTASTTSTVAPPGSSTPPGEPLPMWPAGVGFALAGAGAILGGSMLIASAVRSGDASDIAKSCRAPFMQPSCNGDGQAALDDVQTYRSVSVAGWIVAGAGLAFAIPYTIAASNSGDGEALAIVPVLTPDLQGLFINASF